MFDTFFFEGAVAVVLERGAAVLVVVADEGKADLYS